MCIEIIYYYLTDLPGLPDFKVFTASRLPGFQASRLPGFQASRLQGFKNFQILKLPTRANDL
jgi:hypothetical protein